MSSYYETDLRYDDRRHKGRHNSRLVVNNLVNTSVSRLVSRYKVVNSIGLP